MGRVQQFKREGKQLPPGSAVDKDGRETTDPNQVVALVTFGGHKGYGLALINELIAAFIGGSLPTLRSRPAEAASAAGPGKEKTTPNFFFQVIHPDALDCGAFAKGRDRAANVKAVIDDVMGHGNRPPEGRAILPGELEHNAAVATDKAGGLIFTDAEIAEFKHLADEAGFAFDPASLRSL